MRKAVILLIVILVQGPLSGQIRKLEKRNHNVNRVLREVMAAPDFKTAGFAFYAVDIESQQVVAKVNPDMALRPGSTLKLLSTATALELLGPEQRFETTLEYTLVRDSAGQAIPGDIVIKGGGDPTLGSVYFGDSARQLFLSQWVDAIATMGADTLAGGVVGDAGYFNIDIVPPSWSWQNMGQYYGAGPCGLSVYDNMYSLFFNTSDTVGGAAIITGVYPSIPLNVDQTVTSDSISYDNSYVFGAPYSNERTVRGTLPVSRDRFEVKGSMPDPAWVAASQLDSALRASGIITTKPPTTIRQLDKHGMSPPKGRHTLYTTHSPTLAEIIAETNTHSVNLFAEHCLVHAGIQLGAEPGTVSAADSVVAYWSGKGMDTEGLALYDGSGLSQYNLITPLQLVWLLSYMKTHSKYAEPYFNSMAIAGKTGTLKSMLKGSAAEGALRAKSGTIDGAKAYAGYVTSRSGRKIAFSMVANGFSGSSREARAKLEQLMIALAELNK